MAVVNDTIRVSDMLTDAANQKLVLPNFQREYVWTLDAQKRLLASVLTDIPMGAFLLLHGQPADYVARRVALREEAKPQHECIYLLDGQQRLSTLMAIFASPLDVRGDWKAIWDLLPGRLRHVWRLRVIPEEGESDIFGYRNLSFPERIDIEPEDLLSFISSARVNVKDQDNDAVWFHPNWEKGLDANERSRQVAIAAANEGMVPLWALMSESTQKLVEISLRSIAFKRQADLRVAPDFNKNPRLYEALKLADPTLPAQWSDATTGRIEQAFAPLVERWTNFMRLFILAALDRTVSAIRLQREDVGRAVAIFEVINQGGTPLTPFDLTVAKNARHPRAKNLTQELIRSLQEEEVPVTGVWPEHNSPPPLDKWNIEARDICVSEGALTTTFKNSFLNLLSIQSYAVGDDPARLDVSHIKRKAILSIPAGDIATNWKRVSTALVRTWAFLQLRCGIVGEANLRYKLMVLPLAYAILHSEGRWDEYDFHNRLEYWYWTALFSGVFRERQNENAINEVKLVYNWCVNDSEESRKVLEGRRSKVLKVPDYSSLEAFLPNEGAGAVVGSDVGYALLQYVLSRGPFDFDPDEQQRLYAWQDVELEDHHIVPLASAATLTSSASQLRQRGEEHILNSPLNRTFISRKANRAINSKSPRQYWGELSVNKPGSHLLPHSKSAYNFDLSDDGDKVREFLKDRFERIKEALDEELFNLFSSA